VDVRRKVLGYGKYPDDLDERDFPDMAYASAVRSKYPRARVLKIDTSKAEALPGVLGVLTAKDVPVNQVGHLIQDWDVFIAEGDITRFVGDAICLVVAEDTKTLERAKRLVRVDYEPLEPGAQHRRGKGSRCPHHPQELQRLWQPR
jgi:CO/xanthine dehydrogenase Mo-binding subunit